MTGPGAFDRDLQTPFVLPPDARRVILVRHGAARHDAAVINGEQRADPELTDLGHGQAALVARRLLSDHGAGGVDLFSSGLRRADQTAGPTASALGADVRQVADLQEVGLGDYEGAAFEQARRTGDPLMLRALIEERWDVLAGAEPADVFGSRVRRGLETVAEAIQPGRSAAVFTHGGVVAELCRQVTGSRGFAFVDVDNASLTVLVQDGAGHWRLRGFNDSAHLSPR